MRFVVIGLVILAFAGYVLLAARGMPLGDGQFNLSAISACEGKITSQLVAPATAQYSGWTNSSTRSGPNRSTVVRAYVDSQNSYGAMVRTPYTCTVDAAGQATIDRKL